jgi:integrase
MNSSHLNQTFDEILPSFLEGKRIELKDKSYNGYVGKTKVFSKYLSDNNLSDLPMGELPNDKLVGFFNKVLSTDKKLDRPTVKKYFESIKAVFTYAYDMDKIAQIPRFKGIKFPPKGKDHSAALIPSESLPDLLDDMYKNDYQLYVAWMMGYYCGARPGREIRLVKVKNFNFMDGVVYIESTEAKTGERGVIPLNKDFVAICKEYGIDKADPNLYVFGKNKSFDTRPISENMLRYRFNIFRKKHGLSEDVKFYSSKHIAASMLIKGKILDIEQLRRFLRHKKLASTQHYVHRIIGDCNDVIKVSFPDPRMRVAV